MKWLVGLSVSLAGGWAIAAGFLYLLRDKYLRLGPKDPPGWYRVLPGLTGVAERLVFTTFVGTSAPDVLGAMMAWLAIKLATNWNRDIAVSGSRERAFAFTALLAGLLSMGCAYIGGLIANGPINIPTQRRGATGRISGSSCPCARPRAIRHQAVLLPWLSIGAFEAYITRSNSHVRAVPQARKAYGLSRDQLGATGGARSGR